MESSDVDWHQVASSLPGRNNKDCRKRWHYKIAYNITKGPWTREEDEKLMRAVREHGTKWTRVAIEVGSRNGDQCSKRWNDGLNPEIDHSAWTIEEDKALLESVEARGRNWQDIVHANFPSRTALAAKNRHALLLRRRNAQAQSYRDAGAEGWTEQPSSSLRGFDSDDESCNDIQSDNSDVDMDAASTDIVEPANDTSLRSGPRGHAPSQYQFSITQSAPSTFQTPPRLPTAPVSDSINTELVEAGFGLNFDMSTPFQSPSLIEPQNIYSTHQSLRAPPHVAATGSLPETAKVSSTHGRAPQSSYATPPESLGSTFSRNVALASPTTPFTPTQSFPPNGKNDNDNIASIVSKDVRQQVTITATCMSPQTQKLIKAVSDVTNAMMVTGDVSTVTFTIQ